nr:MAG TPA: ASCH domain protein [Caudoviricetes sp.]
MVRANLEGLKTQTRRILKPQPSFQDSVFRGYFGVDGTRALFDSHSNTQRDTIRVPFSIGDRLWVRESWWIATRYSYGTTPGGCEVPPSPLASRRSDPVHYAADGNPPNCANKHYGPNGLRPGSGAYAAPDPYAVWIKKPSIHMPRWASRLTLIVTGVKIERLQDISEEDAIAEGVVKVRDACHVIRGFDYDLSGLCHTSAITPFQKLWMHINGDNAWEANPWVVAYSYRPIFQNIDKIEVAA